MRRAFALCLVLLAATAAMAGPPFLTDDPEPEKTGVIRVTPLFEAGTVGIGAHVAF